MLNDLLRKEKKAILEEWFNLILETYPVDTASRMKKDKNQFTNPVGATISKEIETLFDGLLEGTNSDRLSDSLEAILKIRSVQDFTPSQAVGFIFFLKKAIGETLKREIHQESVFEEWLKFQVRIDELALLAFDITMRCREKICDIRVNQARAEKEIAHRMMERMNFSREKR